MKPHDEAINLFRHSLERSLTSEEGARALTVATSNTSSDNIQALCYAARWHGGIASDAEFGPGFFTEDGKRPYRAYREIGSHLYDWWTLAAIGSLPHWKGYCAAVAAWYSLHLCRRAEQIAYVRGGGLPVLYRNRMPEHEINGWRNPIAFPPGARNLHLLNDVIFAERGVGGRLLAGKAALRNDHRILGWAGDVISAYLDRFEFGDAVTALRYLRPPRGQKYWLWRDGRSWISISRRSVHNARGPILITRYDHLAKLLVLISPSRPLADGWTWTSASVDDLEGRDWVARSGKVVIEGRVPTSFDELALTWDDRGVHVAEQPTPPPPPPPPEPDPEPDDRIDELLGGIMEHQAAIRRRSRSPYIDDQAHRTQNKVREIRRLRS